MVGAPGSGSSTIELPYPGGSLCGLFCRYRELNNSSSTLRRNPFDIVSQPLWYVELYDFRHLEGPSFLNSRGCLAALPSLSRTLSTVHETRFSSRNGLANRASCVCTLRDWKRLRTRRASKFCHQSVARITSRPLYVSHGPPLLRRAIFGMTRLL